MLRDDRERNFENALARNLQSKPPAGAPAPASVPASNLPTGDCLDPETLAAYHERLLSPEEMIPANQHIGACERCQEILAHLEATDEIAHEVDRKELQTQAPAPVSVPHMQVVHAAGASENLTAHPAIPATASLVEIPRRSSNWRWLVPAGTLAAALLVWVAIHEPGSRQFQLAKKQSQPAPAPSQPSPSSPANAIREKAESDALAPPLPKSEPPATSDAVAREERPREPQARPRSSASRLAAPPSGVPAGDSATSAARAQLQSRVLAQSPAQPKQLTQGATPPSSTPQTAGSLDAATNRITVAPSVPRELNRVAAVGAAAAPAPQKSAAASGGALTFRETSNLESTLVVVSSPDGSALWRLGPSGLLQFSADAGAYWTIQKTGIVAALLAGSAPSSEVCWLAGRNGAVLLTTDAGSHWQKLQSPTAVDITTIFALDTQQATITTAANKSYKTTNAGTTWTQIPTP